MAEDVQRQYWDSCMFIAFLTKYPKRLDNIKELLEQEKNGLIQIVVSPLVIAEVRPIINSKSNKKEIEAVLEMFDSDRLEYKVLTPAIATEAQKLGIAHPELSPGDCVHIATAIAADVEVLFTFDGLSTTPAKRTPSKMLFYDGKLGSPPLDTPLPIKPPYVDRGELFRNQQETEEEPQATAAAAPVAAAPPAPSTPATAQKPCECGCGEYPKDPTSRFLPGHDLRKAYKDRENPKKPE